MFKQPETWLCPLCALVRMKYGTTCEHFEDGTCENIDAVHLTGQFYLKEHNISVAEIDNEGLSNAP